LAKDLTESLRNLQVLAAIISGLLVVVMYRFLPTLTGDADEVRLLLYDAGNTTLAAALETSPNLRTYALPSEERVMAALAEDGEATDLGMAIPADYEATIAAGDVPVLTIYVMDWAPESQVRSQLQTIDGEIAATSGTLVQFAERRVKLAPDGIGGALMPALSLVFIALMNGLMVPANLLLEEKQSRTLDALVVSPVTAGQVVLGKALAGAVYVTLGIGAAVLLNREMINHWGLLALGLACGALFRVGLGLFVGTRVASRQQMMMWNMVLVMPLLLPIFLSLMGGLLPEFVTAVFRLIPTVALFDVFRLSMVGTPTLADWGPRLALALAWAAGVLSVTAWHLARTKS
jgi:ABC-type Na+ efflux pump permease subunit